MSSLLLCMQEMLHILPQLFWMQKHATYLSLPLYTQEYALCLLCDTLYAGTGRIYLLLCM